MQVRDLLEQGKKVYAKIGGKTLAAACAVLVLGSVIGLRVLLQDDEGIDQGKLAVDLSVDPMADGDTTPVGTATLDGVASEATGATVNYSDYFATIALQRKQARDEAMEVLLSVSENDAALDEAKQAALGDMNRMALEIEQEANIETLVQSKGFAQCVAVISDDGCSVIVETNGLMPGEVAQISEIVYEQSGIVPENLKIIEKTREA